MNQRQIDTLSAATDGACLDEQLMPCQEGAGRDSWQSSVGSNEVSLATRSQQLVASALSALAAEYVCPGETHAISHSIHLARLSSFYSKCRECPHRNDLGHKVLESGRHIVEHPCNPFRTFDW